MGIFILEAVVNEKVYNHIGHLWVFSLPFFVLDWDMKGIVSSGTLAASFRQLMLVMEIFL